MDMAATIGRCDTMHKTRLKCNLAAADASRLRQLQLKQSAESGHL
jgi:hypothetical protein